MSNNIFDWIERYLGSKRSKENNDIASEENISEQVENHRNQDTHKEPQPPEQHDHSGDNISPDSVTTNSLEASDDVQSETVEAQNVDAQETLTVPAAKPGDPAPSPTSIAIDPDEGVLLVPEPDSDTLE